MSIVHFQSHIANLVAAGLLLLVVLWRRYIARHRRFIAYQNQEDAQGMPLTFPYVFPLLGSLPLAYLWKPREFVLSPDNFFCTVHPTRVRVLAQEFFVIRGPEDIKALFRGSWACTSIPFTKFALGYAFGLPAKALSLYDKDDSGSGNTPHCDSTVEVHNRVDFRIHQSIVRFLEGDGLSPFWKKYIDRITQRVYSLHDNTGLEWGHHDDLMRLVGDVATVSTIDALCGPYLLSLNPDFLEDLRSFDRNLQTYLQGIPWIFAPKAYAARKRVLNAVKAWQQHARDHCDESSIESNGDDPFWGSGFFRARHKMFLEMDGYDYTAIASQDLGAIWASRNSVTATSWAIFQIYQDPKLLSSVRAEVDACTLGAPDKHIRFDIDRLLRMPIMQAVYAETLRLRMHFYIIRMGDRVDLTIGDWIIPRQKVIVASTTVAHMDSKAWNTETNGEYYPVDRFWIGRFLRYPSENSENSTSDPHHQSAASPSLTPVFSMKGLEGSWIPYGGGPRQCPGRHFAKHQIMLTAALFVSLFDCEITEEGKSVKEDFTLRGFGGGISHPAGKVPIKIRRRARNSM